MPKSRSRCKGKRVRSRPYTIGKGKGRRFYWCRKGKDGRMQSTGLARRVRLEGYSLGRNYSPKKSDKLYRPTIYKSVRKGGKRGNYFFRTPKGVSVTPLLQMRYAVPKRPKSRVALKKSRRVYFKRPQKKSANPKLKGTRVSAWYRPRRKTPKPSAPPLTLQLRPGAKPRKPRQATAPRPGSSPKRKTRKRKSKAKRLTRKKGGKGKK